MSKKNIYKNNAYKNNMYKKNNYKRVNTTPDNNDFKYRPSIIGKIALYIATPAAVIGIVSILLAFVITSHTGDFFTLCLISEALALVGGIVIVIDIVVSTKKNQKKLEKSGQIEKKEKDPANLAHLLVGLGLGILIGYLIWGVR